MMRIRKQFVIVLVARLAAAVSGVITAVLCFVLFLQPTVRFVRQLEPRPSTVVLALVAVALVAAALIVPAITGYAIGIVAVQVMCIGEGPLERQALRRMVVPHWRDRLTSDSEAVSKLG